MASKHPYFRRTERSPNRTSDFASTGDRVDFSHAHLPAYGEGDLVAQAQSLFDARGAACVSAGVALDGAGIDGPVRIWPAVRWVDDNDDKPDIPPRGRDLLEFHWYDSRASDIYTPDQKCLAALAYLDFFPDRIGTGAGLRTMVSAAVLASSPGWCGSFGPGMRNISDLVLKKSEGNYDMTQMHLIHMAYQYYDALSPEAQEHLITELLGKGNINRLRLDNTFTSGRAPDDWDRAGYIGGKDGAALGALGFGVVVANPIAGAIVGAVHGAVLHTNIGETENHILMIATTRYLTNQLLFQRDHAIEHDNNRNGSSDDDKDDGYGDSCTSILLSLLRTFLRDDFSEYNAKSYQEEIRWALLNLCTYAYDHEIRLAARMVLDYVAAHVAVSSNDLRRMVPFRRRNVPGNVTQTANNTMTVSLLDGWLNGTTPFQGDPGPDPLGKYFAVAAGNLRAYQKAPPHGSGFGSWFIHRGNAQAVAPDHPWPTAGSALTMEAVSDYRLPPLIHDLFVTDSHRRFFQRLHRTVVTNEMGGNHNCDNMEIYAGSPSYLITAGGSPCDYAIDPGLIALGDQGQQLGVAVTTSFMPTSRGRDGENDARGLIQFSQYAQGGEDDPPRNYGVAPDFACGHNGWLPDWAKVGGGTVGEFFFLDKSDWADKSDLGPRPGPFDPIDPRFRPGFYLALFRWRDYMILEAFDTGFSPGLEFWKFCDDVRSLNSGLAVGNNEEFVYTTQNGNRIRAVIWDRTVPARNSRFGAEVLQVEYGDRLAQEYQPAFRWDAIGNAEKVTKALVNGTVLNSSTDAVVEIANPALGTKKVRLDWGDPLRPRRTSESGAVEEAGHNHEVWLDFDWPGASAGDVCQPFKTLTAASDAVADGGMIRVVPGTTLERATIGAAKRFTLEAPIGGVVIGARDRAERSAAGVHGPVAENVVKDDVWVEFDFPASNRGNAPGHLPVNTLAAAISTVADAGVIRIAPGTTTERSPIGGGKRFTLSAPIGMVVIGSQ